MEEPAHSKTQNKAIAPDHRSRAAAAEQNPTSKNFQPGKSQKHMIKMHMYVVPAGKRKEKNKFGWVHWQKGLPSLPRGYAYCKDAGAHHLHWV